MQIISSLASIYLFGVLVVSLVAARRHHNSKSLAKCQDKECEMSSQHYVLYSNIKRALESEFNLSGKDIVPVLRSIDVLRKRFDSHAAKSDGLSEADRKSLNGTDLVLALLNNQTLKEALKVFNSDEGRELVTFYRASVNGRGQNLACSQMRIDDLRRVTAKVESNWEIRNVFAKINRNYMKKSAKKCLKHSCSSVDLAMTKLDSILMGKSTSERKATLSMEDNSIQTTADNHVTNFELDTKQSTREFQSEELELCRFFKKTNETDCKMSGSEMGEILLEPEVAEKSSSLEEYLKFYAENNMDKSASSLEATKRILSQCRSMSPLLEYTLSPLKWYRERGLIDEQKLVSRAFWCKGLSYWIQIDRLCMELESRLARSASSSLPSNQVTAITTK